MYNRILVPLDGSVVAEGALAHAAQMAERFDAELILLRSAFLPEVWNLDTTQAQYALLGESEAYLSELARQLQRQERRVRTTVCTSKAAEAIIEYAVDQEVSVVVMATHGHHSLERWPLGSVAEKVLRSMQVPVLLVRPFQPPSPARTPA